MAGSSPLARGLLAQGVGQGDAVRIIPARAGFTPTATPTPACTADHPRSRGVYGGGFTSSANSSGSSPLARGLPAILGVAAGNAGIIPARAGFTE